MAIPEPSYRYRALVLRVVDGDTFDAAVDLGFGTHRDDRFRVLGIDTPERGQHGHSEATAALTALMPPGAVVLIQTVRDRGDKYGRYLAEVTTATVPSVGARMIELGLARPYDGGRKPSAITPPERA